MADLTTSLRALNSQLITRLRAAEAAKSHVEQRLEAELAHRRELETQLARPNPLSYSSIETGDTNVTVSISESSSVKEDDKSWWLVYLQPLWQRLRQVFEMLMAILRPQRQDRLPIP